MPALHSLRLAKEDFKFSAAHITVFGEGQAEPLHGHNYRVAVELRGLRLDDLDFLVPVAGLKRDIRALCDDLDETVLLPERCPYLAIGRRGNAVSAAIGSRRYEFPAAEVVRLPLANVTIEALARLFWQRLAERWRPLHGRVATVDVTVYETSGQSAGYRADLPAG